MALNNDGTSNDGYMKCKLGGSFVGESLCISISLVKLIDIARLYIQAILEVRNAFRCKLVK